MIQDCSCSSANLTAVESTRCGENAGQLQLAAFYQKSKLGASPAVAALDTLFASDTAVGTKALWAACLNTFSGGTLSTTGCVQLTPEVKGWEQSGGDAVNWGEDVDPDGMPVKVRDNPVQVNLTFRGAKMKVNAQLDALRCLAQNKDLCVVFFNTAGEAVVLDAGSSKSEGFDVNYLNVAPRVIGNRDEPDSDVMTLYIPADDWRNMKKVALAKLTTTDAGNWKGIDLLAVS